VEGKICAIDRRQHSLYRAERSPCLHIYYRNVLRCCTVPRQGRGQGVQNLLNPCLCHRFLYPTRRDHRTFRGTILAIHLCIVHRTLPKIMACTPGIPHLRLSHQYLHPIEDLPFPHPHSVSQKATSSILPYHHNRHSRPIRRNTLLLHNPLVFFTQYQWTRRMQHANPSRVISPPRVRSPRLPRQPK